MKKSFQNVETLSDPHSKDRVTLFNINFLAPILWFLRKFDFQKMWDRQDKQFLYYFRVPFLYRLNAGILSKTQFSMLDPVYLVT